MSGVASPRAPVRRGKKTSDGFHTHMLLEEKGHDRSIPLLDRPYT